MSPPQRFASTVAPLLLALWNALCPDPARAAPLIAPPRLPCAGLLTPQTRTTCIAASAGKLVAAKPAGSAAAQLRDQTVNSQRRALQKLRQQTVPRRSPAGH